MAGSADTPSWYRRFAAADGANTGDLCSVLADERRRVLLGVLDRSDVAITETELSRLVAAAEADTQPGELTSMARERIQLSLHHCHLPRLEAYGLIERTQGDAVSRTAHPFWTDSDLRAFLTRADLAPDAVTATLDVLASRHCRAVLAFLHDHEETNLEKLAEELSLTPVSGQDQSQMRLGLAHRHLPRLEAADVIGVGSTNNHITYTGNPVLEEWFGAVRDRGVELP